MKFAIIYTQTIKIHKTSAQKAVASTGKTENSMKWLCHNLNSLHVFCRLRSLGLSKEKALMMSTLWEKLVHPGLYSLALKNSDPIDRRFKKKSADLRDRVKSA